MDFNVKGLIKGLQKCVVSFNEQGYSSYARNLEEIIARTNAPLEIMVMGSFSTGKSSFINALVGKEIVAVDAKPTTAVITKLCYGEADRIVIYFKNGDSKVVNSKEFYSITSVNDDEKMNDIHRQIDYVERQIPIKLFRDISIIDSPGLNDVVEYRSATTEQFVKKADVVLWLFSVVQMATKEEMMALDGLSSRLKPIAIVNKMDLVDEEEDDPEEILTKLRKQLMGRVQAVIGISAKYELEGKKEKNSLKLEVANFKELEDIIASTVLPKRDNIKFNTMLESLAYYLDDAGKAYSQRKAANEEIKDANYSLYIEKEGDLAKEESILGELVNTLKSCCVDAASINNEWALYLFGLFSEFGLGELKNQDKAIGFYQKAAVQNNIDAMIKLYLYYNENDVYEKKVYWLKKLAEIGIPSAQRVYAYELLEIEKYNESFEWYSRAAKQGDASAQNMVGRFFREGWGDIEQNDEEAVKWYRESALNGDADAQCNLALMLYEGIGCDVDKEETLYWLQEAANQGYAVGQCLLADLIDSNNDGDDAKEKVIDLYRKAAEQGYGSAQCKLSNILIFGEYDNESKLEGIKWLTKAAEQDIADAQYGLYHCYRKGIVIEQDEENATRWLRKAAEQGHVDSEFFLGCRLKEGVGCEKNVEEGLEWIERAAEHGDATAQYIFGKALFNGEGIDLDVKKAIEWYEKAASQGSYDAQNELACALFNGDGVTENKEKAITLYKEAASHGNLNAQFNYALCSILGNGCEKNEELGIRLLEQIAKKGHLEAQYFLTRCLNIGGYKIGNNISVRLLTLLAENGYINAQFDLGIILYSNRDEKIKEQGSEWIKKAAENGCSEAINKLSSLGYRKWMEIAAENGNIEAQETLASYYELRVFNVDKDEGLKEAVKWYRRAAEQGSLESQFQLGLILGPLHKGRAIYDPQEANYWLRKSAESGHPTAQWKLAHNLYYGIDCKQDYVEALKWYEKSAAQGDETAKRDLVDARKEVAAAQSSGCLLPIMVTIIILSLLMIL